LPTSSDAVLGRKGRWCVTSVRALEPSARDLVLFPPAEKRSTERPGLKTPATRAHTSRIKQPAMAAAEPAFMGSRFEILACFV